MEEGQDNTREEGGGGSKGKKSWPIFTYLYLLLCHALFEAQIEGDSLREETRRIKRSLGEETRRIRGEKGEEGREVYEALSY